MRKVQTACCLEQVETQFYLHGIDISAAHVLAVLATHHKMLLHFCSACEHSLYPTGVHLSC